MTRSTTKILIALVAVLAIVGFAPQSATAGEYTITACQADDAGYVSAAFENFASRGMKWRRACNPLGPGLRGLVTANVPGSGRVPRGAQSAFVLKAPPETTFSRLRWSGQAQRRDCRYALQLFAERPGAAPISIKNVRANRGCPNPEFAQASSWPRPRSFDLGGATEIVQRVVCVGVSSREFCSARGQNFIRTFAAEATVVDGTSPSVAVAQDSPLTRGQWVRGRQSFTYEASDNVGVKSASALVAGGLHGTHTRPCDYSQQIPCPSGPGSIEVDTENAPEGSQPLTVAAEDSAGNRAESAAVTVRIDNAAPGAVPVAIAGGDAWRNSNDFDLGWANPAEADRAPITAAHYRLCRVEGSECVGGDRGGTAISAVENVAVPAPGQWDLRLWREDAAGNQTADNASQPVRLRFDPEPPQLGFEASSADDPTKVSVLVTDRISGLGGGGIEMSPEGSGTWQTLPTTQEGDRLVSRVDDAALPAGNYELRANAHDLANNLASSDRRLDGQSMRLTLPLRATTSIKAGVRKTRMVPRKKGKGKVRRTVLEREVKVAFGDKVRLSGQLVNRAGHPLADAAIQVYSAEPEGAAQPAGTVSTDAAGKFTYAVEAQASHSFRFVYSGTSTTLPVEASATVLVKAASSFSAKPAHVLNGDSVTFSGRVRGRSLPEQGKLIELQVKLSDGFQTFRTIRTNPDGTWRIVYPFDRVCGIQFFRFRVRIPGEAGVALEPANTRGLTVRVRGRPC